MMPDGFVLAFWGVLEVAATFLATLVVGSIPWRQLLRREGEMELAFAGKCGLGEVLRFSGMVVVNVVNVRTSNYVNYFSKVFYDTIKTVLEKYLHTVCM